MDYSTDYGPQLDQPDLLKRYGLDLADWGPMTAPVQTPKVEDAHIGFGQKLLPLLSQALNPQDFRSPLMRVLSRAVNAAGGAYGGVLEGREADVKQRNQIESARVQRENEQAAAVAKENRAAYLKAAQDRLPTPRAVVQASLDRKKEEAQATASGGMAGRNAVRAAAGLPPEGTPAPKAAGSPVAPGALTPRQMQGLNTLTDNIRQHPDVKDFVTIRDNYKRITTMAKQATGQGDLAIIFAYMKVLDPTSVVRESEYKNAAQAVGTLPQLANIPNKWLKGTQLTPEGRKQFVKAATELYNSKLVAHRRAVAMFSDQAKAYGINPSLVLPDYTIDEAPKDEAKPGKVLMIDVPGTNGVKGKKYWLDKAEQADAEANGWKVGQ